MAQPIWLEVPPRNPVEELSSRLDRAPQEYAEAVLAAYEVLQELHDRGVLDIMRGALAASDEILEKVVDNAKTPSMENDFDGTIAVAGFATFTPKWTRDDVCSK